ncbi:MAG: TIGR04282 family arsenosugar biosynthesis glycosyltransferase [Robiginitomaculum sp.]|nr:TIGR04282 family arsenosugar biosynthesis glycosyltransferase [Robiginitomaculum sp.]
MKPTLFIFAKAPRLGKVKTRLAADIGHVHAVRIYRAMTAKILREMQDPRWDTVLYVTPDNCADASFGGLWPRDMPRFTQNGGGLSERSARLFRQKGPVITIGTDIPTMKRSDIAAGFKALKHNEAVIGPAKDGGFYLIGLNAPAEAGLFDGIRWSHPETRADMCAAIDGRVAFLRELEDVDNLAGYRRDYKGK